MEQFVKYVMKATVKCICDRQMVLSLSRFLLTLVLCLQGLLAYSQTGFNPPKNLTPDYSALKQSTTELLDKLKSSNYGNDFNTLKGTLSTLSSELSKENVSQMSVQALTESAKSEFEKLKSNSDLSNKVEELKGPFEKFKESGTTAFDRAKSLIDNGVAVSMPVTVPYLDNGPFAIRISFDSLRFVRGNDFDEVEDDNTLVNVDATFNFPFATSSDGSHVVRFHGDGIRLEGGNRASRIYLASDHRIDLMKNKVAIEILSAFPKGGKALGNCATGDSTWLDFDCNGVQDMSLCGRFLFSQSFITAATKGHETDTVMAYFSFMYSSGMIAKICFSDSFRVKGCGDFVFKVEDAIVDLSDERNGNGFSMPDGYWDESGLPVEAWSGFFLSKLAVRFPSNLDFNKKKDKQATLEVKNVLIDDYGFTGNFLLRDFIDTRGDDKNSGLALAVDTIGVSFWQGEFSDGLISGRADVPFLKKEEGKAAPGKDDGSDDGDGNNGDEIEGYPLGFRGHIGYNAAQDKYLYSINASLKADQHFKVPFTNKASIDITKDSYLEVGNENSEQKFGATLCLNGALNIESTLNLKGVRFEGLRLSSLSPHVAVKAFSLVGKAGFSVGGFGIELKKIGLKTPHVSVGGGTLSTAENEKDKADLSLEAQISLMAGEGGIGAGVGLDVHAEHENRWKVKGLTINKIMLDLDFSAFHLKGEIERFKNDNQYGDGFSGSMLLSLKEFGFGVQGEAKFGKVRQQDGKLLKYWFTNATADLSGAKILLFPPGVFLKSFSGGAYHHMSRESYATKETKVVQLASKDQYKPNKDIQFGFLAGVGAYFMDDKLCSANVEFEMNFNTNWGVNYVRLAGIASILAPLKVSDIKADGMIAGWLLAEYDRPNKTFHAEIEANINAFSGLLEGKANLQIHSDPKEWYFWMGTRSNPNYLKFASLVKAESYFMLGVIETPMPPMREKLAAKLNAAPSNAIGKEDQIQKGQGFAFGIALEAGGQLSLPLDILFAHFYFLAGTDIMVVNQNCGNLNWRASGQAYLCADGGVGATLYYPWWCKWHPCIKSKEFNILSGTVTTILTGEIPSPVKVSGELHVKCKLFFIPMPKINIKATIGKGC